MRYYLTWTLYKNDKPYMKYYDKDSALRDCLLITQEGGYRNWVTDRTGYLWGDSENRYFLSNTVTLTKCM